MRIALASSLVVAFVAVAVLAGSSSPVVADGTAAPKGPALPPLPTVKPEIAWHPKVADAIAAAKRDGKPLFVAINASKVDGGKAEPAGRELRDNTYRDPAVVEKSKGFACVIVYADASGTDFDELRSRFPLGSLIVSPQHIFAYSDGTLYEKREYWSHAHGQPSVDALLDMMTRALAAEAAHAGTPPLAAPPAPVAPTGPAVPVDPAMAGEPGMAADPAAPATDLRAAWIEKAIDRIKATADALARASAIREFLAQDQKDDCVHALLSLAIEAQKDTALRIAIVRGLGRPGLEVAVPTLLGFLDEKVDDVRSNTIVSLEYIGSQTAVEALTKRLSREKNEQIYANVCRALGRCGAKLETARKQLVRELGSSRNDVQFAGAAIGLAHFEKDADAARALEHEIKKNGAGNKRGFALWALTEIMDPKSAEFVKKEVLANEKNVWVRPFVSAVYNILSDNAGEGSGTAVSGGMSYIVGTIPGGIADSARRGREDAGYQPKGEFQGRGRGGPGGPGGAPPGGPGGMGG